MPDTILIPGNLLIQGNLLVGGNMPAIARSALTQDDGMAQAVPWEAWRVWDAFGTNLPGTAAADDLGLVGGTFGTDTPSIQTGDLKNAGATTRYARCRVELPAEYQPGQPITVRVHGGMKTTVASSSATVDIEAYKSGKDTLVSGTDICATAAQSINSTTFAPKDFTITPTGLVAGDSLDLRLTIVVNDTATATAVIGCAAAVELLVSKKG